MKGRDDMRLIEEMEEDVYSKEVKVAVTLGQLLMIKKVFGKHNTTSVADYLENDDHDDFAKLVRNGELDYELYMEISRILSEMGVEE